MLHENEKTAALVPSVEADGEQLSHKLSTFSVSDFEPGVNTSEEDFLKKSRSEHRKKDARYLDTITMEELYQHVYEGRRPIIDGLLYSGLYILAGMPKIGKSFLVLMIAYHISTGQNLWEFDVHQGSVLYFALEDDYARLQKRFFMMYGVEGTAKLHLAIAAETIGNGLEMQLENFLQEHADTNLIIIDTLQKIRGQNVGGNSYAGDYDTISTLKRFADQKNICVLLVHHTRKAEAKDCFNMISGTTGLLGAADGALLMQKERESLKAVLHAVGRDQPEQVLYLEKEPDKLVWELHRAVIGQSEQPPDELLEAISKLVSSDQLEWIGSPSQLLAAAKLDMAANNLTKYLNVNYRRLLDDYHIKYENKAKHSGRQVKLTYMIIEMVV